jgi:hypothetical protein
VTAADLLTKVVKAPHLLASPVLVYVNPKLLTKGAGFYPVASVEYFRPAPGEGESCLKVYFDHSDAPIKDLTAPQEGANPQ